MFRRSSRFGGPGREGGGGGEEGGEGTRPNVGISIRALWEQMEELIDLLDQVIEVAMSGGRHEVYSTMMCNSNSLSVLIILLS